MRIAGSSLVAIMLLVTSGTALAQTASTSEQFLAKALQVSMVEVELGKLAQKNAQSAGVNALGVRLQRDHARIAKLLKSVSRDKGMVLPTLDTSQSAQIEALSAKTGPAFDAAYVEAMVSNHEKAIALYTAAAQGDDGDLSRLANVALPTLR
jgi:putative membrane protein